MNLSNKTFLPTKDHKKRNWFILDCKDQTLGRLATIVAALLKGKVKPHYYPSIDNGDYIILINANSIRLNEKSKHYFVHTPGRPGSSLKIKNTTDCTAQVIIEKAVKGMLSRAEGKRLLRRLTVCNGDHHPHVAQQPRELNLTNLYLDLGQKLDN